MKQKRNTRQKKMILEAVNELCHSHPSADEIYLHLRKVDDKISRGTVYRNLNILVENREISKIKISNVERFDCITKFHYHLVCKTCGELLDLSLPYNKELDGLVEEQTGFQVESHKIVFEGICLNCKKNAKVKQE